MESRYHVLLYPNITYQKELETDSYIVLLAPLLRELAEVRDDLTFTALLPEGVRSLDLPNVRQLRYPLPTYPNTMRLHFDTVRLLELIDWKRKSVDVVFSHLPEHTLQLRNLFDNATNEQPPIVGYTHWTEFPEITNYDSTVMDVNILGLLQMLRCGINTEAQKALLLSNAATRFNDATIERLDEIVTPMTLGAETPDFEQRSLEHSRIVFNHRPQTYKGFGDFVSAIDELWAKRKDFDVWVPLADKPIRDWMVVGENETRFEYLSNLSACRVGVGMAQKYAGWSVAVTDGYSVGVPYVLHDEPSYRELAGDAMFGFQAEGDLVALLDEMLSNDALHEDARTLSASRFASLTWKARIGDFSAMLDMAIEELPTIGARSKKIHDLHRLVSKEERSKASLLKEMRWGVNIKWTPYRSALRNMGVPMSKSTYGGGTDGET